MKILPRERDDGEIFDFNGYETEDLRVRNEETNRESYWPIDEFGCSHGSVEPDAKHAFLVTYRSNPDAACYWVFGEYVYIDEDTMVEGELKRACE